LGEIKQKVECLGEFPYVTGKSSFSMLSESEKQFLLQTARRAIEAAVLEQRPPLIEHPTKNLLEPCGAFVTIHEHGELRGCIGYIEGVKPLIETILDVAPKAALEDPRFPPVSSEELSHLELEISVLSPMKRMTNINEIVIGKHGLVIEIGPYRGLLLPQVATEYGWDRETFLNQTSRKAGLPSDAWKTPSAKILMFSAEVFDEHSIHTTAE
jgi:AmmeMemoRadiSam system protein A